MAAIAFYTCDYILHVATAPTGIYFAFTNGYMIADFLAVFPFFVELLLNYFNIMEVG